MLHFFQVVSCELVRAPTCQLHPLNNGFWRDAIAARGEIALINRAYI